MKETIYATFPIWWKYEDLSFHRANKQTNHMNTNIQIGTLKHAIVRFMRKVNKTTHCWIWTGEVVYNGYGRFGYWNKRYFDNQRAAHRISWVIHRGHIPIKKLVLHKCDNPPCVNPDHLFIGTHKDNNRDTSLKGRFPTGDNHHMRKASEEIRHKLAIWRKNHPEIIWGENSPNAKLSCEKIEMIKNDFLQGMSGPKIAKKYQISNTHAYSIRDGSTRTKG